MTKRATFSQAEITRAACFANGETALSACTGAGGGIIYVAVRAKI